MCFLWDQTAKGLGGTETSANMQVCILWTRRNAQVGNLSIFKFEVGKRLDKQALYSGKYGWILT